MTHQEFVAAYRQGRVRVNVDPVLAGKYLTAKMLLPVVVTPVIGVGAALMLIGFFWLGLAIAVFGILLPRLIKMTAPGFVLTRALQEEKVYQEVTRAGILNILGSDDAA
ncbi:MAG: hypothetical protein HYU77_01330 [Betaproteobacteria bacterium]|nr:hypothetical protein [Betaproteobacteria bacterium]